MDIRGWCCDGGIRDENQREMCISRKQWMKGQWEDTILDGTRSVDHMDLNVRVMCVCVYGGSLGKMKLRFN